MRVIFIFTIISIVVFFIISCSLDNEPKPEKYPGYDIEPDNINFGVVKLNQSEEKTITIETDELKGTGNQLSKFNLQELKIKEITVNDNKNYYVNTSDTHMNLGFEDDTAFTVIFCPKSTSDLGFNTEVIIKTNNGSKEINITGWCTE